MKTHVFYLFGRHVDTGIREGEYSAVIIYSAVVLIPVFMLLIYSGPVRKLWVVMKG